MTMNKVKGLVFIDEIPEASETAMAGIFAVMNKSWRGMADNQIDSLVSPE
jgi:hypothetical protein